MWGGQVWGKGFDVFFHVGVAGRQIGPTAYGHRPIFSINYLTPNQIQQKPIPKCKIKILKQEFDPTDSNNFPL